MRFLIAVSVVAASAAVGAAESGAPDVVKNGMGAVAFLRFSPNGKELVRICQFGGVEIFDTDGYDKMRTFSVGMRMVAFSADGTRIATAEGTDGARVWDAALPGKLMAGAKGAGIQEVRVLDVPLKVLQAPSAATRRPNEAKDRVFCAEFSPDGKRLITTHADGHVKVWETATWTLESDVATTKSEVRAAAFAPDGKTLVFGDVGGVLHEWNFEGKSETRTSHADGAVIGVAFAPDGTSLVTTHGIGPGRTAVVFWDADRKVVETKQGVASAAFSKDGKTLALGGTNVELFDAATRKSVRVVELPAMTMREAMPAMAGAMDADADKKIPVSIVALAFSPDGATLAAGCQDGTVRLLKTASAK